MDNPSKTAEQLAEEVAKKILNVETLQTRNMDSLDFHEHSVWTIKKALLEMYKLGQQSLAVQKPVAGVCQPEGPPSCVQSTLKHYANTFCEGWCKESGEAFADCAGCLARQTLEKTSL